MNAQKAKALGRLKRKRRVRGKVLGMPERPRLNVFRSLSHIYGQVIDDLSGKTMVAVSSCSKEVRDQMKSGGNKAAAKLVGKLIGQKALEAKIEQVAFDRNGYRYHGRIKEFADGAREAGLKF